MHVHAGRLPPSLIPLRPSLPFIRSLFVPSLFFLLLLTCHFVSLLLSLHHLLTLHPRLHPPLAPKTVQIFNQEELACLCLCVEVKKSEGSILLWKRTHFWTTFPLAPPLSLLLFCCSFLLFFSWPPSLQENCTCTSTITLSQSGSVVG